MPPFGPKSAFLGEKQKNMLEKFLEFAKFVRQNCPGSSVVEHFLGKEEVSGPTPDLGSH